MTAARPVIALLSAGALGWLAWSLLAGEERLIARRLHALAGEASVAGAEDDLARLARAARIGRYFTDGVSVELGPPYPPIAGRESVVGLAARGRTEGVRVELADIQVRLGPDGRSAAASLTATASGLDRVLGDRAFDVRELELELLKPGGEWLIDRVRVVRAIEPPPQP